MNWYNSCEKEEPEEDIPQCICKQCWHCTIDPGRVGCNATADMPMNGRTECDWFQPKV